MYIFYLFTIHLDSLSRIYDLPNTNVSSRFRHQYSNLYNSVLIGKYIIRITALVDVAV